MSWMCPPSGGRRRGERGIACQACSANPDWRLAVFPFMWRGAPVYKGTLRFGACCHSGSSVWCCGLVLGWPFWEGKLQPPHLPFPSPHIAFKLRPCGTDAMELSATQRASSHGSQEQPFIMWLPEARVSSQPWFPPPPPPPSPSLKGVSVFAPVTFVTQALRSQRPVMGWVQSSNICPYLLLSGGLFIPPFLPSWSLLLV